MTTARKRAGWTRWAAAAALSCFPILGGGCSMIFGKSYPVLVRVAPDVDAPKEVDLVWVLTDDPGAEKQLTDARDMAQYFRSGRANLSPGTFRFHSFLREGDMPLPGNPPLEVRSDPGSTNHKFYGPYRQQVPSGARKGYLFISYEKAAQEPRLPILVYPRLPSRFGYEDKAPRGLSITIGAEKYEVVPFEAESPQVVEEAKRQEMGRSEGGQS